MIAVRLTLLAISAAAVLAAFGATSAELQPSARMVMVTSVIALLAPLFWPGRAANSARTGLRVLGWSTAAAALAALAAWLGPGASPPLPWIAKACVMLVLVLMVTHALAAGLEGLLRTRAGGADGARDMAGVAAVALLAMLGALPLWFGPAAELLSHGDARFLDATVGLSPLAHLAVASGNDLLRNQWFYEHSNLASLQFAYPELSALVPSYLIALLALALAPMVRQAARARNGATPSTHSSTEHAR